MYGVLISQRRLAPVCRAKNRPHIADFLPHTAPIESGEKTTENLRILTHFCYGAEADAVLASRGWKERSLAKYRGQESMLRGKSEDMRQGGCDRRREGQLARWTYSSM